MLSKKDLVISACSELELGAFMGIEMKRGLTANGLRQAEVDYYCGRVAIRSHLCRSSPTCRSEALLSTGLGARQQLLLPRVSAEG